MLKYLSECTTERNCLDTSESSYDSLNETFTNKSGEVIVNDTHRHSSRMERDSDTINQEACNFTLHGINNIDSFKELVNIMEQKINDLSEQVMFLRTDSENKTMIINNLLGIQRRLLTVTNKGNSPTTNRSTRTSLSLDHSNEDTDSDPVKHGSNPNVNDVETDNVFEDQEDEEFDFDELYTHWLRDREERLTEQLKVTRTSKHYEFCHTRNLAEAHTTENSNDPEKYTRALASTNESLPDEEIKCDSLRNDKVPWSKGTVLIMGDSTLNGVQEKMMGPRYKVRAFPGAIVRDFYHHAIPLLEKKPSSVVIMVGTNDSKVKTSESILVELLQLKTFIENSLPGCTVVISCPTYRFDEPLPRLTVMHLRRKLGMLNIPVILNENIEEIHIGKKGLHLNGRGSGRLAVNFMSYMRRY